MSKILPSNPSLEFPEPIFVDPKTKKVTEIPSEIFADEEGSKKLTFFAQKSAGWGVGGWYRDGEGKEFMVKFAGPTCYTEKLLTELARIAVGKEFLAEETFVGGATLPGESNPIPYLAIGKIPDYQDIIRITNSKSHAQKFHPAYVFNALIGFDDSNEENFGLSGSDAKPKIIDYGGLPTFLHPEQSEHAGLPFHLASLIGHRNLSGMQLVRRRYFGHEDFINPNDLSKPTRLAPEDITYSSVLIGAKNIITNESEIIARAEESLNGVLESAYLNEDQKKSYMKTMGNFAPALRARITWMKENFAANIAEMEVDPDKFSELKWRMHPKFSELMQAEEVIFKQCAKNNLDQNFHGLTELLSGRSREELLSLDLKMVETTDIKKFVNENFMLHNAIMSEDLELTRWLVNNDLADINKTRNIRNHNYQNHRTTPLHAAIAGYHDKLFYSTPSPASEEMIAILKEKFFEKNGPQFDEQRDYASEDIDGFAIRRTFEALNKFQQKASPEALATTKIQRAVRSHHLKSTLNPISAISSASSEPFVEKAKDNEIS